MWAERYDRDLKDIFALQDEITIKIVTALRIKLTEGEQARMWAEKTKNLDLLLKRMEARSLWAKGTVESHIRFGQLAQEIVDMAPEASYGYMALGWHNWYLASFGKSPRESIAKAFKLVQKALSIDESDAYSHCLLGSIYLVMRKYEKAIAAGKRSIELAPNGAMVHGGLGLTLSYAGRPDEAIGYLNKGIRLNPFPAYWYFQHLGRCYLLKGQYEDALKAAKKALLRNPDASGNHRRLAVIYALLNRQEEASAAAKKALEIDPSFSVKRYLKMTRLKNQADIKLVVDAMRKAGFPDKQQTALQDSPRKEGVSATTMNSNNVAINLNGEWDTIYDLKEYGVSKDVVQITQKGNKFVGIKLIGSQWVPKGSETIKGDIEDNRIKSMFLKNSQGWAPAEWRLNEQGNEIFLKQHMDSIGLTIDVKLTRK